MSKLSASRTLSQNQIKRLVAAARASGLDVAAIELWPDGRLVVVDAKALPTRPDGTIFNRLNREGKI